MYLEESKEELFTALESLPDFAFNLDFHCDSSILPFFKSLAPRETFTISKSGSSIRLDLKERACTFLFKGRTSATPGDLLYLEQPKPGKPPVIRNVLCDFYHGKLDEEVTRLIKKKEQMVSYEPIRMEVVRSAEKAEYRVIDGYRAEKRTVRAEYQSRVQEFDMKAIKSGGRREYLKNVKTSRKEITLDLWLISPTDYDQYPLSLPTLRPLLSILSFANKHLAHLHDFLFSHPLSSTLTTFPIQASFPLRLSFNAHFQFSGFRYLLPHQVDFNLDETVARPRALEYTKQPTYQPICQVDYARLLGPTCRGEEESLSSEAVFDNMDGDSSQVSLLRSSVHEDLG